MRRLPSRPITATDVARAAGVSQSAVSRTFTPGASVAPATRAKVLEAVKLLGYRPNALARSLITGRSRIVAVVMAYLDNQFYPDVLEELSGRLQERDHQVLLFTAKNGSASDPLLDQVMRYQVDAVVLASTTLSSALARECRAAGVPVVLFNRTTDDPDVSSVTGDNLGGAERIAAFLAAGGHRALAFMAGSETSSTNRDRERGFLRGIARAGLPKPTRVVGHYTLAGAAEATRALLSGPARPDAIFCANDHMAIACIDVARHAFGLRVPEDLSVVGFDDVGAAAWRGYDLTTFSQPLQPMVEATVGTLMDLLENPEEPPRAAVIKGELVVRGSARLPAGGFTTHEGRRVWRP
ncbi:LacI family DNA-binding transcriptional regulator [Salinarimonas soli]|uniref:Substrate-binding domain-containing protein n=1 Tax=Salinarimonas soli TaxID=1638099 RepID=A0A5B2W1B3_9HYPH|nr:LacI family DNA-binding transcriptional regulator [Salinarimonas soli]KAA2244247.1 substrate-binding domain-containing protein [Salinarimonas soli]